MIKLNFNTESNQDHYGGILKIYLLQNSEVTTNVCFYCHSSLVDDECLEWAACSSCCSWVVMNCIHTEQRIDDYCNNDYFCILCE